MKKGLDSKAKPEFNEIISYIENLNSESVKNIDLAVKEWTQKIQDVLEIYGGKLSPEKEVEILNNMVSLVSSSEKPLSMKKYILLKLTKEILEKKFKG